MQVANVHYKYGFVQYIEVPLSLNPWLTFEYAITKPRLLRTIHRENNASINQRQRGVIQNCILHYYSAELNDSQRLP